jgi:hypothetical protein
MKIVRVIIGVLVLLSIVAEEAVAQPYSVTINTLIVPPVSAYINQSFASTSNVARITCHNNSQQPVTFKIYGRITKVTPPQLSVEIDLNNAVNIIPTITLNGGETKILDYTALKLAFANFSESYLKITPDNAKEQIRDGINYKLPEGEYNLCIMARRFAVNQLAEFVADPNPPLGCGYFTICKLSAPQFIQPVNNLNINSEIPILKAASPFVFTWLPPQASCNVPFNNLTYSFEIREILDNQTITDAINNPFVFRKTSLRTSTFLLDSNLYKNVLHLGKKYAIRVKAEISTTSAPLSIENQGYSRIEAFQYGTDVNETAITMVNDPAAYFIPSNERKIGIWDSIYSAYINHTRGDTLIPVKEYISLHLTENGLAYNQDAIELFLALNPGLTETKTVKLSRNATLPVFSKVSDTERKKFNAAFETNLQPDINEERLFKSYLDSFHTTSNNPNLPTNVSTILKELEPRLNSFNEEVHTVNRVSVNFVNRLMLELLRISRSKASGNSDYTSLRSIASNIIELTTEPPGSGLSMNTISSQLQGLLCYYKPAATDDFKRQMTLVNYSSASEETEPNYYFVSSTKQLLPFDVVVWKYSKDNPPRPISDAPDLTGIYRILYTTPALYNEKNPEINAISSSQLASTTVVSLPANSGYYIWGQNMLNHQLIKPQKVDINDAFFLSNKKNWPTSKNYKIVLKVN